MGIISIDSTGLATKGAKESALADMVGQHHSNGLRLI